MVIFRRIVVGSAAGLTIVGLASCGTPSAQPKSRPTTTAPKATAAIFGALNINADWQVSGGPVPGGTDHPCVGTGDAQGVQPGAEVDIQPTDGPGKKNTYSNSLGNGITVTGSNLSLPGVTTTGFTTPQICQFGLDVSGLPPASQYQVTISIAGGKTLGPFTFPRTDARGLPTEITLDPQTTTVTTTTTTTAPPVTMLSVTGTGSAISITILDGTNESQHNGQALPYTTTLSDNPQIVGLEAQTDDGSSGATITCTITGPYSLVPVTNTSTGPYAVVNCTSGP